MQRDDVGIIVLTSGIAAGIRDRRIKEAMLSSMKPLFIVVSDPNDKAAYEDNLRQLIIRALGVDIMKTKSQS
jgi:vacuolar-type H+-ATPase subunit F/Vma7